MSDSAFGFERADDSPGFLLWKTTVRWQRLIKEALERYDISHSQFVIMAILLWWKEKKTDVTQIDLVKESQLDKMTVSKALRKLEKMGLVGRHENASDSRAKTVYLSDAGVALTKKLVPVVEGIDAEFFGILSDMEHDHLLVALQKLS